MLLNKSDPHHHSAHGPRRPLGPEALYLQRLIAWSAVVVAAFVGIELIINDRVVVGLPVTVLAIAGAIALRSHGLTRLLRSTRRSGSDQRPTRMP